MTRRVVRLLPALLGAAGALLAAAAGTATAQSPVEIRPVNMRVSGAETPWHADNYFRIDWDQPPLAPDKSVTKVEYRMLDTNGSPFGAVGEIPFEVDDLDYLHVPPVPGVYAVEVRLEVSGQSGLWSRAYLRFDDVRPGHAQPLTAARWIAADEPVAVRVELAPSDPVPVSGIRGYALAVDQGLGGGPCAGPSRCTVAETDLLGGTQIATTSLGPLPEGVHFVRAVAVSGSGMRSAQAGTALVRVDGTAPTIALDAPTGWSKGPVRVTARATDRLSGMDAGAATGAFTALALDGAVPRSEWGDAASLTVSGEGRHEIEAFAQDTAGNNGARTPTHAVVAIDLTPPTVHFAAAQDPAEPERIEAVVADGLSGPGRSGTIAIRRLGSHTNYATLPTTVAGDRLVAHWDSDAAPAGEYEFRTTGFDLAGNSTVSEVRANGKRMVLSNPLKEPTQMVGGFGGRRLAWQRCKLVDGRRRCQREELRSFNDRPTSRAVPYGRALNYGGRLTTTSGRPLADQPVEVVESFAAGSTVAARRTTIRTSADGIFVMRLQPGPGRHVEAVFPGNRTLCRTAGGPVELAVQSGLRFSASTRNARVGGPPVIFSGRLHSLDAGIPSTGRPVQLQFRYPGSDWSEFRTVQTDRRGRFRYAYSFSDDDSRGISFQFRAFAPAQDDWPYAPASSSPVFVTGH